MSDYIKYIVKFCNNKLNGKLHLKMFSGKIVYLDKLERIFPKEKHDALKTISVGMCSEFVDKLREQSFFGDLSFNFINGKITEIEVSKTYKSEDIEKYLSDSG